MEGRSLNDVRKILAECVECSAFDDLMMMLDEEGVLDCSASLEILRAFIAGDIGG